MTEKTRHDEHSGSPDCSLRFVGAEVAKTWPYGAKVLIKRIRSGHATYEADNWHRPDWVDLKLQIGTEVEWMLLEET